MKKIFLSLIIWTLLINSFGFSQDEYLKITVKITPEIINQGEEGILKLNIFPKNGIKISSSPEFMIKLDDNSNLTFSKIFFTASELDFETEKESNLVFIDLNKEISIPFKVKDNSLLGKQKISGEIIFTAVFKDRWSLKTYQKFQTSFRSRRSRKSRSSS